MAYPNSLWLRVQTFFKDLAEKAGLTQKNAYGPGQRPVMLYAIGGVALTALIFYFIGSSITGGVVMKQVDLCQAQIDEWASKLANSTDALNACRAQGDALSGQLNSTKAQLASSQLQTASRQQQLSSCQNNVDMLKSNVSVMQSYNAIMQGKLSDCQAGLDSLNTTLRNSVAAVCCSYGDVQAATVKNWQVQDGRIVCSGSGTVNCATGALG